VVDEVGREEESEMRGEGVTVVGEGAGTKKTSHLFGEGGSQ